MQKIIKNINEVLFDFLWHKITLPNNGSVFEHIECKALVYINIARIIKGKVGHNLKGIIYFTISPQSRNLSPNKTNNKKPNQEPVMKQVSGDIYKKWSREDYKIDWSVFGSVSFSLRVIFADNLQADLHLLGGNIRNIYRNGIFPIQAISPQLKQTIKNQINSF